MTYNNVCCVGAGLLGVGFSSVLALKCPEIQVHVVDEDEEVIRQWNTDEIPVYEPGLNELIVKTRGVNLFFTSDTSLLKTPDIIFVCPKDLSYFSTSTEMKHLEDGIRLVTKTSTSCRVIVLKSSLSPLASEAMSKILKCNMADENYTFISSPEIVRGGQLVNDLLYPKKTLLGVSLKDTYVVEMILSTIYEKLIPRSNILMIEKWQAEFFCISEGLVLAQAIVSMNSLNEICEATNTSFVKLVENLSMDSRLQYPNLNNFIGFKGLDNLRFVESMFHVSNCFRLPEQCKRLIKESENQKKRFAKKIKETFSDVFEGKNLAVLGFSTKSTSSSIQNSASVYVCKYLLSNKMKLTICDPLVSEETILEELKDELKKFPEPEEHVKIMKDPYEATKETEAIIICTEWPEVANLNFEKIFSDMTKPAHIFDGNNTLRRTDLVDIGFEVHAPV